jgi:PAS domain S-box-containing protein
VTAPTNGPSSAPSKQVKLRQTRLAVGRLIALSMLLSLVPLVLLTFFSVSLSTRAVGREARARVGSTAQVAALSIHNDLQGLRELVHSFAQRPSLIQAVKDLSPASHRMIRLHLNELEKGHAGIASVFLTNPSGQPLEGVPSKPPTIGRDFSSTDWYRGVTSTGKPYVSEADATLAKGKPRAVAVADLVWTSSTGKGKTLGIIVAVYDVASMGGLVEWLASSQSAEVSVTDQRGTVLAKPGLAPTTRISEGNDLLVQAALHGHSGVSTREGTDGPILTAFEPIPGLGWTVITTVPLAPAGKVRSAVLAIAGLMALALLAGLALLARSLRERDRAERDAKGAEAFLDSIVENIPNMVFVKDAEELRFARFNRAGEGLLGVSRKDLIGKNDYDLFPKKQAAFFTARDREVLASGTVIDIPEERIDTNSKGTRILHTKKIPILGPDGSPRYLLGISEDITERRQVQAERDRFFTLSLDMLCVADFNGYFRQLNPSWETTLGFAIGELMARPFIEFVHPDDREATSAEAAKLATGAETIAFENRYRCKDGSYRWLLWSATASAEEQLIYAVARDITDRKRSEDLMRKAREEAEEANRAKSEFVSTVSHELRTPLTMIQGFSELLLGRDLSVDQAREALTQIHSSAERLSRLVGDLLSVSSIEAGRISVRTAPLELPEVIQHVVAPFAPDRVVRTDLAGSIPPVFADRDMLTQVLTNLVSNAVKYSPGGEPVCVGARRNGTHVVVSVQDRGIGLTEEQQGRLFEKFFRADRQEVRRAGGTGLGLFITKNLVELQGGAIWMESEHDRGSTFFFSIPLAAGKEREGP